MKPKTQNTFLKLPVLDGLELLHARHHTIDFPFHTHNTFNITLVLEQTFTTKLSDRSLQAPVGTIVITNPDEVHATICDSRIGSSFFTFYVSPDVLKQLNHQQPVYFDKKIISDPPLFHQLMQLSQGNNTTPSQMEKALLGALKALVSKHASSAYTETKSTTHFRRFLETEAYEKFSLENAAHRFGLDKFKFLRLFKYETGLTPNSYILLKRIEKCKQLLQTRNDLLGIAIETGFYDAAHLSKHFKKLPALRHWPTTMPDRVVQYCTIGTGSPALLL